ncbi:YHS domain-containing protein [Planctomycetota bacterium]
MKKLIALVCLLFLIVSVAANAEEQTVCPVMEGNPVKKDIFIDYRGKRVYFCCQSCKGEFSANPEKYLAKLPPFSVGEEPLDERQHERKHFSPARLVEPTGIATFSFLAVTLLCGLFMKKNRKLLFPWHKRFAFLTVLSAVAHATLIVVFH